MNAKVCALIDEDGLRWIKERVTQEFFPHEAQKILGISLSSNQVPDLSFRLAPSQVDTQLRVRTKC